MMRWLAPLVAAGVFILDRLSKAYFLTHPTTEIQLIPNVLWLQYHLNERMALSLPLFPILYFTLVAVVILVLIAKAVQLQQDKRWSQLMIVGCVLAGAISNLLDRLLYGGVVDFISVNLGSVFNLADIAIVASVAAWLIVLSYADRKKAVQTHS
jgi:signal peptidase II